jgi:hypothetical protein
MLADVVNVAVVAEVVVNGDGQVVMGTPGDWGDSDRARRVGQVIVIRQHGGTWTSRARSGTQKELVS